MIITVIKILILNRDINYLINLYSYTKKEKVVNNDNINSDLVLIIVY